MISHIIYAFTSPSAFRVKTNSMAAADIDMPLAESSLATSRRQHLGQTFEAYRAELDDDASISSILGNYGLMDGRDVQNALREKLIILSRSITQLSKKLIFHLHRGANAQPDQRHKNLGEAEKKEREIAAVFKNIRQELSDARGGGGGGNTWESGFWKWRKSMWVKYSVGR